MYGRGVILKTRTPHLGCGEIYTIFIYIDMRRRRIG
jgi:hypothetical protein